MPVGETLSRVRHERGLSVEDITAATRIRAGLIRSIEIDDFTPCGGAGLYGDCSAVHVERRQAKHVTPRKQRRIRAGQGG